MRAFLAIPVVFLMLGSSEAQTPTRILKGVNVFELIVDTDRPSRACGIAKAAIQEQVMQIGQSVGLALRPVIDVTASMTNLALRLTMTTKHGIFTTDPNEAHQWHGSICATGIRLTA